MVKENLYKHFARDALRIEIGDTLSKSGGTPPDVLGRNKQLTPPVIFFNGPSRERRCKKLEVNE